MKRTELMEEIFDLVYGKDRLRLSPENVEAQNKYGYFGILLKSLSGDEKYERLAKVWSMKMRNSGIMETFSDSVNITTIAIETIGDNMSEFIDKVFELDDAQDKRISELNRKCLKQAARLLYYGDTDIDISVRMEIIAANVESWGHYDLTDLSKYWFCANTDEWDSIICSIPREYRDKFILVDSKNWLAGSGYATYWTQSTGIIRGSRTQIVRIRA